MTSTRQLHFGAFMRPASIHTGAWRFPGAWRDANFNLAHLTRMAQRLEAAKFDAFFMADHLAVLNMPVEALKRSHTVTSFEPMTLLSALAVQTSRIGLVATASTTFEEPFHVARRFASLDHISGGRAAWNIVTTSNPDAALNFSYETQPDHDARYVRAREYFDVVTGLWDSFADDAFIRDAESGIYFDPERLHHDPKVPLVMAGDFNMGERPTREAALLGGIRSMPGAHGTVREALGSLMGAGDSSLLHSADARTIHRRARDMQFMLDGATETIRAVGADIPFGTEPDGSSLSDHLALTTYYRLSRT